MEGHRRDLEDQYGAETANRVINACLYGQVTYDDHEHYEETNVRCRRPLFCLDFINNY